MSLLSENVSLVAQAQDVQSAGLTIVAPSVSTHFTFMSGTAKEVVGYVAPRNDQYTYVLDVNTGKPLELPNEYLPILGLYTAVQNVPDMTSLYVNLIDSPTDPDNGNTIYVTSLDENRVNGGYYEYFSENVFNPPSGLDTAGYRWIVIEKNSPDPILSGIIKVVISYQ